MNSIIKTILKTMLIALVFTFTVLLLISIFMGYVLFTGGGRGIFEIITIIEDLFVQLVQYIYEELLLK
ncbi:MAG: hypothetical protein ACRC0S_06460 [Fusobacteriaceae bacterium]